MSETVLIAIISACSAIIPSIASIILNNRYNLKLKKYEITTLQKQQIATEFLENVGKIITFDGMLSSGELGNFDKSCNKLLLYFPNIDLNLINKIRKILFQNNPEEKLKLVNELVKQLSKSIFEK